MNNTVNELYFRELNGIEDSILFQCYINKNKKALERKFYDDCLICSWAEKSNHGYAGDFIYCKGTNESSSSPENINKLFSEAEKGFVMPSYDEYEKLCMASSRSMNIGRKITKLLKNEDTVLTDKSNFEKRLAAIAESMHNGFKSIRSFERINKENTLDMKDVSDNIFDGTLSFIGCYHPAFSDNIKTMLIFKLMEKYYGSGEADTIYSYYRSKGSTYISCSGYYVDYDLFCTGIVAGYDKKLAADVFKRINEIEYDDDLFKSAKKRFIDDICYSCFQFGEQITLMPYSIHTGKIYNISNILEIIENIRKEEFVKALKIKKYTVKAVI